MHVILEFFVPLENFLLIWRRHHCRWRAANFDLCSALKAIALSGESSSACHTYCDTGHPFLRTRDTHTCTYYWAFSQWGCHYLFLWLRSIPAGIRTSNLPRPLVGRTLYPPAAYMVKDRKDVKYSKHHIVLSKTVEKMAGQKLALRIKARSVFISTSTIL